MRQLIYLAAFLLTACVAPAPPAKATGGETAAAAAILPVLNATFPFRVEANDDPKDPLGVRRVPTDRVVLRPLTQPPSDLEGAVRYLNAQLPAYQQLVEAWRKTNEAAVLWPLDLLEGPGVVSFDRVNAKIEGDWWKGLAQVAPMASSLVTLSRPGYSADGKRALLAASVEPANPPRIEVYYLLERDGSNWVVTNSLSRQR